MRPITRVFQDLAQVNATPVAADLNTVMVGPCYVIKDYPDDATETLLTDTYGRLNDPSGGTQQYIPPNNSTDAVTLTTYPGNSPGALVDHDSVVFTLKNPRVCMGATYSGCGTVYGTVATTFNVIGGENKVTVSGATFSASGVKPGDLCILTSSDFTQTVVRTVLNVGEPDANGVVTDDSTLRFTANLPSPSVKATGSITAVAGASLVDGETFTINDGVNTPTVFEFNLTGGITGSNVAVAVTGGDSAATVAAAIRTAINNVGGTLLVTAAAPVGATIALTNDNYGAQGNVTITDTVANVGFTTTGMSGGVHTTSTWIYDTATELRIERVLTTQTLLDPTDVFVTFPEANTDKCVLKGGITLGVTVGTTTVQKPLSYAGLYVSYRALRQDLGKLDSVIGSDIRTTRTTPFFEKYGKIDARNPLAVALSIGLQNSGAAPIFAYGVGDNSAVGHIVARDALSSRRDLHCFVILTQDQNTLSGYKFEWEALASPDHALEVGVPQLFRMVLGNVAIPTTTTITDPSITGQSQQQSGSATAKYRTLNVTGTPSIDLTGVLPGDIVEIGLVTSGGAWSTRRGTHKVAHVNSSSQIEIEPGSSRWNDSVVDTSGATELRIISGTTGAEIINKTASLSILDSGSGVKFQSKVPTQVGGPYRVGYTDTNATTPTVSITGFDITVNVDVGVTTFNQIITAVNSDPVVGAIVTATLVGSNDAIATAPAFAALSVGSLCAVDVALNDDLYVKLYDSNARFFSEDVQIGDVVETPVNPNNYTSNAFSGSILSFTIAQIVSENILLINKLGDDSASASNELPHAYARDVRNLLIDNDPSGSPAAAINYRIRRVLNKDGQVLALTAIPANFRSKRVVITLPDEVTVADLVDGSLPRASASIPEKAGRQKGYYLSAALGGAMAGLPVQQGMSNMAFNGISRLYNSSGYFREEQLSKLSDAGFCVFQQPTEQSLPTCIHQLTTDITAVETGEISVVRNVDYVSIYFQLRLDAFLGTYNALPETLDEVTTDVNLGISDLKSRKLAKVGAPLVDGSITSLYYSGVDHISLFLSTKYGRPINGIDLHIVY